MADSKKYYYLKLKENFFDSEEMILLQNMQDGYLYSDILMKLYLRSLKNNGKLMFKDVIPYTPELLAQVVRHQVGTVKQALQIFQKLELIEVMDSGAIYMSDIQNFIGKSSTEADRKRLYRQEIFKEKNESKELSGQLSEKSLPEIEIEKEIEIKEKKEELQKSYIEEILDYYNNCYEYNKDQFKIKKIFRLTSKNKEAVKLIKARLNENYTVDDFKDVIFYKYYDFVEHPKIIGDKKSLFYYRPETLFNSSNFAKYKQEYEVWKEE